MKFINIIKPITQFYLSVIFIISLSPNNVFAVDTTSYISNSHIKGSFILAEQGKTAPIFISSEDYPGVKRAVENLQKDIFKVTSVEPILSEGTALPKGKEIVIVGTLGQSSLVDKLVKDKKIDVGSLKGKWEKHIIQVVEKPFKGVDRALVIAGSDKRGTIFGIYDLSSQIGVSPWYWWADVPVRKQENLYVMAGTHSQGEPKVKYRGIFINDEAPALSGWAYEKFGGFNAKFYENVFELILRMKGNYLWPAMWGRQFYVDDPLNPKLADEYGVVIGTSHHEPMMRAHAEWEHFGDGPWNYKTNKESLQQFWKEGIERMGDYESLVTVGMRGDGDEPMAEGTEISLLEGIVKDQREIIKEVTGKKPEETPQVWALYKEVQDYYDKGMRVPDDITLLLADDNWGNIRKLPALGDTLREGGYGIYYHYDYVGGPRNYKWINTNPIARVWEQMHLAYEYGANELWIVNVGDIKPMEFPTSFFLEYAWNPEKWPAESLSQYTKLWAKEQFGEQNAEEIADILTKYAKYNGRRKPELLSPETYSLIHYREAETVVADYNDLAESAEKIYYNIPAEYRDAYYQLVLYPVKASANLNEMYVTVAKNRMYAKQGRAATNEMAEKVKDLFEKDAALSDYYHTQVADGKWNHMMSQTHISYTYWQQPDKDVLPEIEEIEVPVSPQMGIAIEGVSGWWPEANMEAVLPEFDPYQDQEVYIEIFNRGQQPFDYKISTLEPAIKLSAPTGKVEKEVRVLVSIDWHNAPQGKSNVPITISGPNGQELVVQVMIHNPESPSPDINGFIEGNGYVSMEAKHYTDAITTNGIEWTTIPDLGKTMSGVTPFPVTASEQSPGGQSPHLSYNVYLFDAGEIEIHTYLSPTLNFHNDEGLKYAISIDNEVPQTINLHSAPQNWDEDVADNIKILTSRHTVDTPGEHIVKFWMVDPGVVLQKIVIDTGGLEPSYLGPPESFRK